MKDVLTHNEMCSIEKVNLQRGMNFRPGDKNYSILLMSVMSNSPYNDGFSEDGRLLTYEGEDVSKRDIQSPKSVDQPIFTKTGLTNNGKFFKAAEDYKLGRRKNPEKVKVYEKVTNNVWSDKGWFYLIDVYFEHSLQEKRKTFKFILSALYQLGNAQEIEDFEFSRRIPTRVKQIVWERDGGRCVDCGATTDLHFDHILPFSKGGTSTDPSNVQILCSRHNLKKSNKIL